LTADLFLAEPIIKFIFLVEVPWLNCSINSSTELGELVWGLCLLLFIVGRV
jgi:hypothetical protein